MQRLPQKRDANGRVLSAVVTPFDPEDIKDRRFVAHKDRYRQVLVADSPADPVPREILETGEMPYMPAHILPNDRPIKLVDDLRYTRPEDIDAAGLQAALKESPWSDDYWAIYRGELGCRYADPRFPGPHAGWEENFNYVREHPARAIVASGDELAIDQLSPSEKYDLFVDDADGTLTNSMWAEGKAFYDHIGTVETWMGICHGWAPAAYQLPRPRRAVTAVTADGRQLRFYPSDIKALASLLWANAGTPARQVGSRTHDKNPATDEVGRITSIEAFDTNPGTWHLSITNQLAGGRSFVMDATYDYEVWNQPVFSYEYSYFNPQEDRLAVDLRDATVMRDSFTNDRFRRYRSPQMEAVVGVAMRVGYVVETAPSHAISDDASNDAIQMVDYLYDLELDGTDRIIGGEWRQNAHPDFLWTPPLQERALAPEDQSATGSWTISEPLPDQWRRLASQAARRRRPLPLARIVENLIQAANS